MKRRIVLLFASVLVLLVPFAPANAITNGQPDNGAHPFVGQLLFFDPAYHDSRFNDNGGWFNCSGTLLNSSDMVTAGHCTYGTGTDGAVTPGGSGGNDVWVSFDEVPDYSMIPPSVCFADAVDYTTNQDIVDLCASYGIDEAHMGQGNAARYAAWMTELNADSSWHRGTSYPHPEYNDNAFYLHDAGVVILDDTVTMPEYGQLPTQGLIDELYAANHQATYTPVGYGLESSMPWGSTGGDSRNVATVKINNLNGVYGAGKGIAVGYSSNKGKPHTGGTCFGDSGGPTFPNDADYSNVVITVTSFGIDPNCKAGGGGYRLDQPDDLNWLEGEFGLTP